MSDDIEDEVKWRMGRAYDVPMEMNTFKRYEQLQYDNKRYRMYMSKKRHMSSWPRQTLIAEQLEKFPDLLLTIGGDQTTTWSGKTVLSQARGANDKSVILYSDHRLFPKCQHDQTKHNTSYIDKNPIAIWRGNSTGGITPYQRKAGLVKYKIRRKHFCDTFKDNPYVDAKLAGNNKSPYFLSPRQQASQNRYLISLEGNDSNSNLRWIFSTTCICLLPETPTAELTWHYHLEPWVHYVPFKHDLSDFISRIEWCENNVDECLKIIENANNLFAKVTDIDRERKIISRMLEILNNNLT